MTGCVFLRARCEVRGARYRVVCGVRAVRSGFGCAGRLPRRDLCWYAALECVTSRVWLVGV